MQVRLFFFCKSKKAVRLPDSQEVKNTYESLEF